MKDSDMIYKCNPMMEQLNKRLIFDNQMAHYDVTIKWNTMLWTLKHSNDAIWKMTNSLEGNQMTYYEVKDSDLTAE